MLPLTELRKRAATEPQPQVRQGYRASLALVDEFAVSRREVDVARIMELGSGLRWDSAVADAGARAMQKALLGYDLRAAELAWATLPPETRTAIAGQRAADLTALFGARPEIKKSESVEEIKPGDQVDFGAYGQLYVTRVVGDALWATDDVAQRHNPDAPGWALSKSMAKQVVESPAHPMRKGNTDPKTVDAEYNRLSKLSRDKLDAEHKKVRPNTPVGGDSDSAIIKRILVSKFGHSSYGGWIAWMNAKRDKESGKSARPSLTKGPVTNADGAVRKASNNPCQCADPGCPVCHGQCTRAATTNLVRTDMDDRTGTQMCAGCAEDAMESGLFEVSVGNFINAKRTRPSVNDQKVERRRYLTEAELRGKNAGGDMHKRGKLSKLAMAQALHRHAIQANTIRIPFARSTHKTSAGENTHVDRQVTRTLGRKFYTNGDPTAA